MDSQNSDTSGLPARGVEPVSKGRGACQQGALSLPVGALSLFVRVAGSARKRHLGLPARCVEPACKWSAGDRIVCDSSVIKYLL